MLQTCFPSCWNGRCWSWSVTVSRLSPLKVGTLRSEGPLRDLRPLILYMFFCGSPSAVLGLHVTQHVKQHQGKYWVTLGDLHVLDRNTTQKQILWFTVRALILKGTGKPPIPAATSLQRHGFGPGLCVWAGSAARQRRCWWNCEFPHLPVDSSGTCQELGWVELCSPKNVRPREKEKIFFSAPQRVIKITTQQHKNLQRWSNKIHFEYRLSVTSRHGFHARIHG